MNERYIISIDQSTSASKAFLIDADGAIVKQSSLPHKQYYPASGRVEHDAEEIWQNVQKTISNVSAGIPFQEIAALTISNQRETTVLWERESGKPVCPAIVWQDVRGEAACQELAAYAEEIHAISGLLLSPYYPAGKLKALFSERPDLRERAEKGELCAGTIDSYLIYRMTGGLHVTDTTNASRTQMMNLRSLSWDTTLLKLFDIPIQILPSSILPADSCFGEYNGIPICGVLGDSHAALFGQGCHTAGMAKATYGTGSSVMMNIGETPVISNRGLSTSVAYSKGDQTFYALEGNITCSGDTLVYLCETLGLFSDVSEIEKLANCVENAQGVRLIPAFSGLGAPYFDSDARAVLCGINRGTQKAHIAYAALDSIVQQDTDVLEIMQKESGYTLECLFVDGGPTRNKLLMQMQSDLVGCKLQCAHASELSALGVAYLAGLKIGFYESFENIPARKNQGESYLPKLTAQRQNQERKEWEAAVQRAKSSQ